MKKQLNLFIGILIMANAHAQKPEFIWAKQFAGTNYEEIASMASDNFGNLYITGRFKGTISYTSGYEVISYTCLDYTDIYISKLDPIGNIIWVKRIGGRGMDYPTTIKLDDKQNIYLSGQFMDYIDMDPGSGEFLLFSDDDPDAFICKLSNDGNLLWAKQIGGLLYEREYVNDIVIDNEDNILITGSFTGKVDFNYGKENFCTAKGEEDIFICKFNSTGEFKWVKQIGNKGLDTGTSIALDSKGNIYTTGTYSAWIEGSFIKGDVDFDPGSSEYFLNASNSNVFVSKLDPSGNFIWANKLGGVLYNRGYCIHIDNHDNLYLTGIFEHEGDFDPGIGIYNLYGSGETNSFICKLDSDGKFVSAISIGSDKKDYGSKILVNNQGDIYLAGRFNGTLKFSAELQQQNFYPKGLYDIYLFKFDSKCKPISFLQVGGIGDDNVSSMIFDIDQNILLSGTFSSSIDFNPRTLDDFVLTPTVSSDGFISKYKFNVATSSLIKNSESTDIIVYPNPTKGIITINIEQFNNEGNITILNQTGQILETFDTKLNQNIKYNIIGVKGIYYIKYLSCRGFSQSLKIIKE
jgi:hypothetical protein